MRFSLHLIVGFIVLLLFVASIIALYFATTNEFTIPLLMVAIINIEAVVFLVFLITRGIIRPLDQIQEVVRKVGEGNFRVRIAVSSAKEIREFGHSMNEMIQKLQIAKEREDQIDRLKTEFLSLAAHQLRTPLSEVKWTLQMLLDEDLGRVNKKQKEALEKSVLFNDRLIHLVHDLLNVTRIEGGKYLFKTERAQLEDIVVQVVESHKEEAKRKKLVLKLQLPQYRLPPLLLDKEKIGLAVQNLVDNALHYTQKGSVVLTLQKQDKGVELAVQDSGIGIPKDQQARVFERFFRARNARTVATEGTGLGLYLAKNIVEAHGGKIWFESQEGKGTAFHVLLPQSY